MTLKRILKNDTDRNRVDFLNRNPNLKDKDQGYRNMLAHMAGQSMTRKVDRFLRDNVEPLPVFKTKKRGWW